MRLILSLGVNVLNDLTCILMHDQLANLRIDLAPKILLLRWQRSKEVCLLSQMVGILLRHQLHYMLLEIINHVDLLVP